MTDSGSENILDSIIYGRPEPHIYAFETNKVPNSLKVGDTYRPVSIRLQEWRKHFENLVQRYDGEAKVNDEYYFRDHAVHTFLTDRGFSRVGRDQYPGLPYFSNEFFRDVRPDDIDDAVADIKQNFKSPDGRYGFYRLDELRAVPAHYERNADWQPRENQKAVIGRFMAALAAGRTNLLMYAVMRFGKSFTALCCAKEMGARLVAVVCGKADVRDEWQANVERPVMLDGYDFVSAAEMSAEGGIISRKLGEGRSVVVFLTLQDLLGDRMKEKHRDLFELNRQGRLDLLIIDETHFAARSPQTGKVLEGKGGGRDGKDEIFEDAGELEACLKHFDPRVKLHLSGTPYRILIAGEFSQTDIIGNVQYSDILSDKRAWDENLGNDGRDEWENPYYGFPQMVRFAFNLNQSARKLLEDMGKDGVTYKLDELLAPRSTKKSDSPRFKHEAEVLDLLRAIDGSKADANIFSFLDYQRIRDGKMCRHMVMALPYRASCDAMEALLGKERFLRLGEYSILNISGFNAPRQYQNTDRIHNVKRDIASHEREGRKTLTLTAGRMLTGNTVREWDTMIFLRDTSSPQMYDQATFRLQSQYVRTAKATGGNGTVKLDMKPQTLLVDFDPARMFVLEDEKALISNINKGLRGNENLELRLRRELELSPVIFVNKDRLCRAEPTDIAAEVIRFSKQRSALDETFDITVDGNVLDNPAIRNILSRQPEMNGSGAVFKAPPVKGEGGGVEIPEAEPAAASSDGSGTYTKPSGGDDETKSFSKRLQAYYFKMLLFAFLSDGGRVRTVSDIIASMGTDADGQRIGRHLGIKADELELIRSKLNPQILNELENKIEKINALGGKTGVEGAQVALKKFSKISGSEIVTPQTVAAKMLDALPPSVTAASRFLDIASKEGEFAFAILKRYGDAVRGNIYSIPTSGATYEFTRKVYTLLGLPVGHIFDPDCDFTTFGLADPDKKETIIKRLKDMNFNIVVGNPPYQEDNKGDGNGSDPIYHKIIDAGREISVQGTMIHPARFLFNAGKTPKAWNQTFLNDSHVKVVSYWADSNKVFPNNVTITGGIAVTYWNGKEYSIPIRFFSAYQELRSIYMKVRGKEDKSFSDIMGTRELYKLTDVLYAEHPEMANRQSKGHKYSLGANVFDIFPELFYDEKPSSEYAQILGREGTSRCFKWFKSSYITHADNFDKYKVIISKADGAAGVIGKPVPARILGKIEILAPYAAYTDTFIGIGRFGTRLEAEACKKYIMTMFARTMLGTIKVTQDNSKALWLNVPLQDFTASGDIDWTQTVADIDRQLFRKYGLSEAETDFIKRTVKPME